MAENAADTEQFPWSQHASLTYQTIPVTEQFFIWNKKSGPEPVPYLEFLLYYTRAAVCRAKAVLGGRVLRDGGEHLPRRQRTSEDRARRRHALLRHPAQRRLSDHDRLELGVSLGDYLIMTDWNSE